MKTTGSLERQTKAIFGALMWFASPCSGIRSKIKMWRRSCGSMEKINSVYSYVLLSRGILRCFAPSCTGIGSKKIKIWREQERAGQWKRSTVFCLQIICSKSWSLPEMNSCNVQTFWEVVHSVWIYCGFYADRKVNPVIVNHKSTSSCWTFRGYSTSETFTVTVESQIESNVIQYLLSLSVWYCFQSASHVCPGKICTEKRFSQRKRWNVVVVWQKLCPRILQKSVFCFHNWSRRYVDDFMTSKDENLFLSPVLRGWLAKTCKKQREDIKASFECVWRKDSPQPHLMGNSSLVPVHFCTTSISFHRTDVHCAATQEDAP